MSSQGTFKTSRIGKLEQLSTVEARRDVLRQRDIRPGHTSAIPGEDGDITGWSRRYADVHGRPKTLAPHLQRLQNTLGADGQPRQPGDSLGVASNGEAARKLEPGDRIPLPDIRDEKGHNLKNRITRVRGGAS